jgi:3-hydroxy-3-methylglutaryl CoA synthase
MRETDETYIKEIDTLFKMLQMQYQQHPQDNPFFPRDDSPALIEVFGSRLERIQMIKLYLDAEGDLIGGDGSASDIFNPENLDMMEQILKEQSLAKEEEEEVKKQLEAIKEFQKETKR